MHNLHLIRTRATSHEDACASALCFIEDWGTENNWRVAGGALCEDGTRENYDDWARWPAVCEGDDGWQSTVKTLNEMCRKTLEGGEFLGMYKDTIQRVFSTSIEDLLASNKNWSDLYAVKRFMNFLSKSQMARTALDEYDVFTSPGFYEYDYGEFGLTVLRNTEVEGDDKIYIVLIDMHT